MERDIKIARLCFLINMKIIALNVYLTILKRAIVTVVSIPGVRCRTKVFHASQTD